MFITGKNVLSAPVGRFLTVNMDQCKDITGRLFEHVTLGPEPARGT